MSAKLFQEVAIACYALTAVMLVVSVVLFIRFRIKAAIGYLTGRAEKKAIEDIRRRRLEGKQENEKVLIQRRKGAERKERPEEKEERGTVSLPETEILTSDCGKEREKNEYEEVCLEEDITFVHTQEMIE